MLNNVGPVHFSIALGWLISTIVITPGIIKDLPFILEKLLMEQGKGFSLEC